MKRYQIAIIASALGLAFALFACALFVHYVTLTVP